MGVNDRLPTLKTCAHTFTFLGSHVPHLQEDTLQLQYVIAQGEIVKTPDWVRRCGGLAKIGRPLARAWPQRCSQGSNHALIHAQVRGGMFERGPGIRPRKPGGAA